MKYPHKPSGSDSLRDILPRESLLLMGAGPVPIAEPVSKANGVIINHLGDTMARVVGGVQKMAQYVFQTNTDKIIGVAGPSSAAMEMTISNLLWPGRRVLVLKNGTFSHRFGEMAQAVGAEVDYLEPETQPGYISVEEVKKAFASNRYDVLTITHGETSCGVLNPEIEQISSIAKKHGALMIVDAVVTLGAMPVFMDKWHLDAVIAGGQKALGSIPGISLVAFSSDAWQVIENRKTTIPHWCLDARRAWEFWGFNNYHYTAPVPGILALHEALNLIEDETLAVRFARHKMSSHALQEAIKAMGLKLYAPEEMRLNSVVAIKTPRDADSLKIRRYMSETFGVEISGAFGLEIMRIGQMGEQCRAHNLFKTIYALGISCRYYGVNVDIASAMSVLEENLALDPETFVP